MIEPATVTEHLNNSVSLTTAAINAVKAAWDSWVWIVPIVSTLITQAAALIQGVNSIPGVKWIAGNYGHSANK